MPPRETSMVQCKDSELLQGPGLVRAVKKRCASLKPSLLRVLRASSATSATL